MVCEHTLAQPKLKVTLRCKPTLSSQRPYQVSTFYTLRNPRNSLDKILKLMVTMTRSKVKSRSHHDIAHLQPPINILTMYQLPTPFQDGAWTRFHMSRSLQQGRSSNKGHIMLHTSNPQPMSLSSINFLHLTISETQP